MSARYAMQYTTYLKADGEPLIFQTDAPSRIYVMASLLNALLAKGYRNDQVDWYEVNRYLCLMNEPNLNHHVITSFSSFMALYKSVDCTNIRMVKLHSDESDVQKHELLFKIGGRNAVDEYEVRNSSLMDFETAKCS